MTSQVSRGQPKPKTKTQPQPQPLSPGKVSNIEINLPGKKIIPAPCQMSKVSLVAAAAELKIARFYAIWQTGDLKPITGLPSRGHQQHKASTTSNKPSATIQDFVFVRDLRIIANREEIRKGLLEKGFSEAEVAAYLANSFDKDNFKEGQPLHEAYLEERQEETRNRPVRAAPRWNLGDTEEIIHLIEEVKKEGKSVAAPKKPAARVTKKPSTTRVKKETSLAEKFAALEESKVLYISMVKDKETSQCRETAQCRQYTTIPQGAQCYKYSCEGTDKYVSFQKDYTEDQISTAWAEMGVEGECESVTREALVEVGQRHGQVVKQRASGKKAEKEESATTTTTTTATTATTSTTAPTKARGARTTGVPVKKTK